MDIVERIKQKSAEKGTNIANLEKELGIGNGVIRRWNDRNPGAMHMLKVAERLNVSVDWILTGKEAGDLTPEEQQLVDYYRNTNSIGQGLTMQTAKANSEALPAEQQSLASGTGSTGTDD